MRLTIRHLKCSYTNPVLAVLFGVIGSLAASQSLNAQDLPVWRLVEDVRVGPERDFTRILSVLPFANGSSIIADQGSQEITLFDQRGRFLRRIGRNGQGPGEFVQLRSVGLLGDTLWIIDGAERRTSFFSLDGKPLATVRTELGRFITAVLRNDASLGLASANFGSGKELRDSVLPVLLTSRAGRTADTIAWAPAKNDNVVLPRSDGGFSIAKQFFSDAGLILVSPNSNAFFVVDRSVASHRDGASFSIAALALNGDTVWYRSYAYEPKTVAKSQVDSLLAAIETRFLRAGHTRAEIKRALFIPQFYPPITSGVAGADGSLWLRREEGRDSTHYWIIDKQGRRVGQVNLPTSVTLMAAAESMVWAVRRDEFDVPTVVRYRIQR